MQKYSFKFNIVQGVIKMLLEQQKKKIIKKCNKN